MAQGLIGDLTAYSRTAQIMFAERLAENVAIFNANSGGCISMDTNVVPGLGSTDTYWARNSTAGAQRRDITSSAAITKIADANVAEKEAKQFTKATPYSMSISAIQNLGSEAGVPATVESYVMNRSLQIADDYAQLFVNCALSSIYGAIQNTSALQNDQSSSTVTANFLQSTLQNHGDQQGKMQYVMMHSAIRSTLVTTSITANRLNDVAPVINGADPATLGRRQIITDNSNMYSGSPAVYRTYFLAPGAIQVSMRETVPLTWKEDHLTENIGIYATQEAEVTVRVPGYTYAGGNNPTTTTLALQASWTQTAVQDKAIGISMLLSKA